MQSPGSLPPRCSVASGGQGELLALHWACACPAPSRLGEGGERVGAFSTCFSSHLRKVGDAGQGVRVCSAPAGRSGAEGVENPRVRGPKAASSMRKQTGTALKCPQ